MHVTARVDYAMQAMLALAHSEPEPVPATELAEALDISYSYLLAVIGELRRAKLVRLLRGAEGGLVLARPATEITLDQIIWAIDGPLTVTDGTQLDSAPGDVSAGYLPTLWFAAHRAMLDVFSQVRLADATTRHLPTRVAHLLTAARPNLVNGQRVES
jgi:Rrf2 family protein